MDQIHLRRRLGALTLLLGIAVGCGAPASERSSKGLATATAVASVSPVLDCLAPMDPASPSLAGAAPAWITFDRSFLGPRNTARSSADPTGILIVVGDEVPSIRFYVLDAPGRRLALSHAGAGPVDELNLHQDEAQLDRGNVWLTRVAVRFVEPGCYYAVFEGLQEGPQKVQIRIDP